MSIMPEKPEALMTAEDWSELGDRRFEAKDKPGARVAWEQAARMGDYFAMYNLGCMHYFGDEVEPDAELALSWFVRAAETGDAEAANRVGVMHQLGIGVAADEAEAFSWLLRSAKMGSLSGMANVATAYLEGKGTKADIDAGLVWMEKASIGGNGVASLALGQFCSAGNYVAQDFAKAKACFERGVDQLYPPAALALADLYERGLGVEADPAKAAELRDYAENMPEED